MYSKRAFRCDCGNSSMRNKCQLKPKKDGNKDKNKYNHNFVGKYCRCDRGQDVELGEMFQCIICEDWFREKCLLTSSSAPPSLEDVARELICSKCSDSVPLLGAYHFRFGLSTNGARNGITDKRIAALLNPNVCVRPPSATTNSVNLGMDHLWTPGFRRKLCRCASWRDECARFHVP